MKPSFLYILTCLIASALLSGCTSTPLTADTPSSAAATPANTATAIPPTATPEPEELDTCLTCHQDKQLLIDTAKQEEEVASENSGEG